MLKIYCPICHKRVCDSEKTIKIFEYSFETPEMADIIIKCTRCKAQLWHLCYRCYQFGGFKQHSIKILRTSHDGATYEHDK